MANSGENKITNKNIAIALRLFTVFLLLIFFSGCTNNTEVDKFVGKWEWSNGIQEYEFTFYKNGSMYSYYFNHENDDKHEGWGNFELLEGKKVRMYTSHGYGGQPDEETYDYEFSDDKSQLTLSSERYATIILNKVNRF